MKGKNVKMCTTHCPFFPQEPDEIEKVWVEEGVTRRKVKRFCQYDGKQILNLQTHMCPWKNRREI